MNFQFSTVGRTFTAILCFGFLQAGCASDRTVIDFTPPQQTTNEEALQKIEELLSGNWEYDDKYTIVPIMVTLDEHGHGPYDFKDGYLYTTNLTENLWEGWWYQRENDREGGFEIQLSEDFSIGKGRWWYTRIGADTEPKAPGEKFQLTRAKVNSPQRVTQSSQTTKSP